MIYTVAIYKRNPRGGPIKTLDRLSVKGIMNARKESIEWLNNGADFTEIRTITGDERHTICRIGKRYLQLRSKRNSPDYYIHKDGTLGPIYVNRKKK